MSDQARKQRAGPRAVLLFIALTVLSACISDGVSTTSRADTSEAPTTPIALGENGQITVVEDCSGAPRSGRVVQTLNGVTLYHLGPLESDDPGFAGLSVMQVEIPTLPCRYSYASTNNRRGLFSPAFETSLPRWETEINSRLDELLLSRIEACQRWRIVNTSRCTERAQFRLENEAVLFGFWTHDGTSPAQGSAVIFEDEILFEVDSR